MTTKTLNDAFLRRYPVIKRRISVVTAPSRDQLTRYWGANRRRIGLWSPQIQCLLTASYKRLPSVVTVTN